MKRIFCNLILILLCGLSTNCFLNPLSQFVTDAIFPTKENCPNCTEQQLIALAAVIKPNANGIKAFGFDLSSSFSNFCASGICAGGITEAESNSTVTVAVPNGAIVSNLVATFSIPANSKLEVAGVTQVSGVTANDFTKPVTYSFIDENGLKKDYTVSVVPATNGDRVNGVLVIFSSGLDNYWTKCSYGQVYRPGFNDCQGKGSAGDDYGAITDTLSYCSTADASCDDGFSLTSGPLITACQSMQSDLPAMQSLSGVYSAIAPPPADLYSGPNGSLMAGCPGFKTVNPCFAGGSGGIVCLPGFTGIAIDTTLFSETFSGDYWTTTSCTATTAAKISMLGPGLANASVKNLVSSASKRALRCVRRNLS
ncbi:glycoside hydrolase xylanase [Leptospira stimsonii]|uniref:Glycoside hydrolase xylanase n=1 Tax=Leptospira stimsonii TaxID=2202203 RepID=A0ABY2NAN8_9LEPT|nr:glycoside hydrolase xylanase [Leptospira stimsonii]TGM20209.1 glycoside hydrolase xylanase [Leptospira stimsonii]